MDEIRNKFEERLASLENDARRAYYEIKGIHFAPFPITMYACATIDYFSSCWVGWNDLHNRPPSDTRFQIKRMSDFLEKYLNYPQKESQVALEIWRHKLMHTAEPRPLRDAQTAEVYVWLHHGIPGALPRNEHWKFHRNGARVIFQMGLPYLIEDLRKGVLGNNGYFEELCQSKVLQINLEKFFQEMGGYTFSFRQ